MTAARPYLSLVKTDADVIPLPRRTAIEHNALRHAVLREAVNGLILRDCQRITINGRTAAQSTGEAVDDLVDAGCIAWTGGGPETGQAAGITRAGRRQLAAWERRTGRPHHGPGGDAA